MIWTSASAFFAALAVSVSVTPHVGRFAGRHGFVDLPSTRKVHKRPIPRIGGVAIFLGFMVALASGMFLLRLRGVELPGGGILIGLFGGAALAFGLGLIDDIRSRRPGVKLVIQALAGGLAWVAGISINAIALPGFGVISLGWLSLPVTVFWFLLVINAINLIDGLDGLAAGVAFFCSAVLLVLGVMDESTIVCVGLAALAGACLGFLRWNFNPARIFMGDSGSYFIGFTLAALSILGSVKSQASVAILIPIIALGLPLADVCWSTIRRFLAGQAIFRADSNHLHHRLLKRGYSHRRAVLVLYGITVVMGCLSLLMVHASDRQSAIILVALGVFMATIIRKLGYIDHFTREKLWAWLQDVADVLGLERNRRTFFGIQTALAESRSVPELWDHLVVAARHLGMDQVSLELRGSEIGHEAGRSRYHARLSGHRAAPSLPEFDRMRTIHISLPLGDDEHPVGCLTLDRAVSRTAPELRILRRVERLRRTASNAVMRLSREATAATRARRVVLTPRAHFPSAVMGAGRSHASVGTGKAAGQGIGVPVLRK